VGRGKRSWAIPHFKTKSKLAQGGPRCSDLSLLLPLPRIHTTRGCFGEARGIPGHLGTLTGSRARSGLLSYCSSSQSARGRRGVGGRASFCSEPPAGWFSSPVQVVPARPTALDPRGAASSRLRGSCWAGSRPPESTRLASAAVAGLAECYPETCRLVPTSNAAGASHGRQKPPYPKGHLDGG